MTLTARVNESSKELKKRTMFIPKWTPLFPSKTRIYASSAMSLDYFLTAKDVQTSENPDQTCTW